jgi:hypothetical protein
VACLSDQDQTEVERSCVTESLQIDNALRIAARYTDSKAF